MTKESGFQGWGRFFSPPTPFLRFTGARHYAIQLPATLETKDPMIGPYSNQMCKGSCK